MCVYFIQESGDAKRIKIGYTDGSPMVRLRSLSTGSPFPLTLLLSIAGGAKEEASLHARFADLRQHGEWFEPNPKILRCINELKAYYKYQSAEHKSNNDLYGLSRDQVYAILGAVEHRSLCDKATKFIESITDCAYLMLEPRDCKPAQPMSVMQTTACERMIDELMIHSEAGDSVLPNMQGIHFVNVPRHSTRLIDSMAAILNHSRGINLDNPTFVDPYIGVPF